MFLCLVWLLFAGQSGGREMLLSLKKSLSNILVRSFVLLVPLWDFGQDCIQNIMAEIIMAGADSMLKTALRILGSQRGSTAGRPRTLQAPADPAIGSDDEDSDED